MLEILAPTVWICFTIYTIWYFTSAKHHYPITVNEAKILWKIHKQSTRCKAEKWYSIKRNNQLIGFKCSCGYKYVQSRPLRVKNPSKVIPPYNMPLAKLHTPYKSE
jgi:hypothetical protein